jgi:putative phosphoesterase
MVAPMETDLMLAEANKLDVDVLCWGGTHRFDAYEYENKFFVNPGSATGAFTTGWVGEGEEMVPSFCLMDVSTDFTRWDERDANWSKLGAGDWFDALCVSVEEECGRN